MKEVWKSIDGFDGYEVSNKGRVRSYMKYGPGNTKNSKYHLVNGHSLKFGYVQIDLRKNGKRYHKVVHRLVAEAFLPNPHNKPNVCHIDDNPSNNCINNLYWGTQKDNISDEIEHGHYSNNMTPELNAYGRSLANNAWNKPRMIPVVGTNLRTGKQICFESITSAGSKLSLSKGSIGRSIKSNGKCKAGDWTFKRYGN